MWLADKAGVRDDEADDLLMEYEDEDAILQWEEEAAAAAAAAAAETAVAAAAAGAASGATAGGRLGQAAAEEAGAGAGAGSGEAKGEIISREAAAVAVPPAIAAAATRASDLSRPSARRARRGGRRRRALTLPAPIQCAIRAVLQWQGLMQPPGGEAGMCGSDQSRGHSLHRGGSSNTATALGAAGPARRALPPPATWPHRPVFVRFNPRAPNLVPLRGWATRWGPDVSGTKPPSPVDLNVPVNTESWLEFESDLFVGKIVCRFKGVGCPANEAATQTKVGRRTLNYPSLVTHSP